MPMEYMFYIFLFLISSLAILLTKFCYNGPKLALPPGSFGWLTIGNFMDLQRTNRSGKPYEFTTERMEDTINTSSRHHYSAKRPSFYAVLPQTSSSSPQRRSWSRPSGHL
ncbi:hypothetical protein CKAN_00864900 [Cinnamomum micranthum f. kanehirae]|uniref:Uncharacterized protein n=1 Tax=Cinnamomum micranthum f. kanehirae TaxID=337451 RepID=A0A3S3MHI3_9MAGN|nr:hypothetical protein CKAN_00864900 [Cinnamomum micranthum f. kanehirae]